MNSYDEDMSILIEIDKRIAEFKERAIQQKELMCKNHAPVKAGDTVTVNGYSHTGKKMIVTHVVFSRWCSAYRFKAIGKVIKKDGTVGTQQGEWEAK